VVCQVRKGAQKIEIKINHHAQALPKKDGRNVELLQGKRHIPRSWRFYGVLAYLILADSSNPEDAQISQLC
jgi:hypothetical protein